MFVCCEYCVLSGRGLCDELITRPEDPYGMWCVVVCDLETSWMRSPWPTGEAAAQKVNIVQEILRGVFKKRPNCLNSAPTSKESALRLLSTPSVRFWLQTAVCPVSPWALIFEPHPLNWARAQAVRRISDKVTMKELEEQRVCVKFCCKLGKNFMGMMLKPRWNRRSGWGKNNILLKVIDTNFSMLQFTMVLKP